MQLLRLLSSALLALVAVHKNPKGADLVNECFDRGVATDAKADGGKVHNNKGVEDQHRGPPAGPPAHAPQCDSTSPMSGTWISILPKC